MTYAIRGTSIIHELLQDEVIIANLDAGIYYSIRGGGVVIWQLLLAGLSIDAIEILLAQKYGQIPSISPFVGKILEEELLFPVASSSPTIPSLSWPAIFEPPTIERYDEMKNLLMLDPIHEVDEQGWPQRK